MLTELHTVFGSDTAAVDNTSCVSDLLANGLSEPFADVGMDFLGLYRRPQYISRFS